MNAFNLAKVSFIAFAFFVVPLGARSGKYLRANSFLVEVLGTIAEQERASIKQRQAECIAAAKVKGVELGRPKAQKPPNWEEVIGQWKAGEITATKAMELTGTKRTTFYKLLGA